MTVWVSGSCEVRDFPQRVECKNLMGRWPRFPSEVICVDSGNIMSLRWKVGATVSTRRVKLQIKRRAQMFILDGPSGSFSPMSWTMPPPSDLGSQHRMAF